jgi:hypothetical protein
MRPIWQSKLDTIYDCTVERTGERTGLLKVTKENQVLLEREVGLSYGATFGPDIEDVEFWQEMILEFIDNQGK